MPGENGKAYTMFNIHNVPASLRKAFKLQCALERKTMRKVVIEMLEQEVANEEGSSRAQEAEAKKTASG